MSGPLIVLDCRRHSIRISADTGPRQARKLATAAAAKSAGVDLGVDLRGILSDALKGASKPDSPVQSAEAAAPSPPALVPTEPALPPEAAQPQAAEAVSKPIEEAIRSTSQLDTSASAPQGGGQAATQQLTDAASSSQAASDAAATFSGKHWLCARIAAHTVGRHHTLYFEPTKISCACSLKYPFASKLRRPKMHMLHQCKSNGLA